MSKRHILPDCDDNDYKLNGCELNPYLVSTIALSETTLQHSMLYIVSHSLSTVNFLLILKTVKELPVDWVYIYHYKRGV